MVSGTSTSRTTASTGHRLVRLGLDRGLDAGTHFGGLGLHRLDFRRRCIFGRFGRFFGAPPRRLAILLGLQFRFLNCAQSRMPLGFLLTRLTLGGTQIDGLTGGVATTGFNNRRRLGLHHRLGTSSATSTIQSDTTDSGSGSTLAGAGSGA
jgi:hypothetical protein